MINHVLNLHILTSIIFPIYVHIIIKHYQTVLGHKESTSCLKYCIIVYALHSRFTHICRSTQSRFSCFVLHCIFWYLCCNEMLRLNNTDAWTFNISLNFGQISLECLDPQIKLQYIHNITDVFGVSGHCVSYFKTLFLFFLFVYRISGIDECCS